MKKLLFFAFCIFNSVFILPSDTSGELMLERLEELHKKESKRLSEEIGEILEKSLNVAFVFVAKRNISEHDLTKRFLEDHQRILCNMICLEELGYKPMIRLRVAIETGLIPSEAVVPLPVSLPAQH